MAIVLGVLAALAIVSAVGSASKVQRRRAAQLQGAPPAQAVTASIATPALPAAEPPVEPPQATQAAPSALEPPQREAAIDQAPTEPQREAVSDRSSTDPQSQPASDPMVEELAESILERMPDVPLATSLLVSEVVNPEGNDLGVQLDRPNLSSEASEAPPAHHSTNLLDEIAHLKAGGDRIAHLAQFVEHPDSLMRVSAAYALGDLATRTQGADRNQIIAILVRLSEDVDPQVRVQAASALGSIEHPAIGE